MEGEEKSKKFAKEKRSIKKPKAVALSAKGVQGVPATKPAPAPAVKAKRLAKAPATNAARRGKLKEPTFEQIQLEAYFIGERRKKYGIPGDQTSDWVEAELTLKAQFGSK